MEAFSVAFAVVFFAELADKSQLLAMAFAARYGWRDVLLGICISTVINQSLAGTVGFYLGHLIDYDIMQLIASIAFVGFALWTLSVEDEDEQAHDSTHSPMLTVATACLVAEFGDKTQLATVTIAATHQVLLPVIIGAVLGMIIADGLGIMAGNTLRRVVPEAVMRLISAAIFFVIGAIGIYDWLIDFLT